jgi:hypothetical protein
MATERVNPSKSKLFGAVTSLKTGVTKCSHPLDQCNLAWCDLRFSLLIVDVWWQQMLV